MRRRRADEREYVSVEAGRGPGSSIKGPCDLHVKVVFGDAMRSEYPVRYDDGRVVWDHPSTVPARLQREAEVVLRAIARWNWNGGSADGRPDLLFASRVEKVACESFVASSRTLRRGNAE